MTDRQISILERVRETTVGVMDKLIADIEDEIKLVLSGKLDPERARLVLAARRSQIRSAEVTLSAVRLQAILEDRESRNSRSAEAPRVRLKHLKSQLSPQPESQDQDQE